MTDNKIQYAVMYCRVSDPKQATSRGDGLKSQETRLREFANFKGFIVLELFSDDMTGGDINRPGVIALLKYLRKHRAKNIVVLIDDISRFARDVRGHWDLRDLLREAGGRLMSPKMEFKDDADSIMVENIHATFAQHHRQKNAEQTTNRMRARVMNGYAVFMAPVGFKYHRVTGRGMMLKRDEPAASVVQEALEGYASGRFGTQADVMRFLQDHPLFPKGKSGVVKNNRVTQILSQCTYAGYVEAPRWDVPLRPGQHEPLISFQTYQRIQERMNGASYAPRRTNLNSDFPLRGHILCADCSTPLTACWSSGTHRRYPYYHCPRSSCESYGKSVRREKLEGEFEELLRTVAPTEKLFDVARAMFKDLWDRRLALAASEGKGLTAQLSKIEQQIAQILDRILDVSVPSIIATYEDRVRKLEIEKQAVKERIAKGARPASSFDDTLRTALDFLSNPWNLWASGRLEDRRAVLRLVFANRLRYSRTEGLRTATLSLPFKALGAFAGGGGILAHPTRFERMTLPSESCYPKSQNAGGIR